MRSVLWLTAVVCTGSVHILLQVHMVQCYMACMYVLPVQVYKEVLYILGKRWVKSSKIWYKIQLLLLLLYVPVKYGENLILILS